MKGTHEHPGIIFEYHPTRAGDAAVAFLQGYKGVVQTDGYSGYGFLDNKLNVSHMGCWAHARRKFMDALKAGGLNKDGKPRAGAADQALKYIRKLYKIEKEAKLIELTGEDLIEERQTQAKPILDEFKRWLDVKIEEVPPQSLLGKAIGYALNQWYRLIV
jgi:transposase